MEVGRNGKSSESFVTESSSGKGELYLNTTSSNYVGCRFLAGPVTPRLVREVPLERIERVGVNENKDSSDGVGSVYNLNAVLSIMVNTVGKTKGSLSVVLRTGAKPKGSVNFKSASSVSEFLEFNSKNSEFYPLTRLRFGNAINKTKFDPWFNVRHPELSDDNLGKMWKIFISGMARTIVLRVMDHDHVGYIDGDILRAIAQDWNLFASKYKISLNDVARVAMLLEDGCIDYDALFDKCIYTDMKHRKCIICHIPHTMTKGREDMKIWVYDDDTYAVSVKDKGTTILNEYATVGKIRNIPTYVVWLKKDIVGRKVHTQMSIDQEIERQALMSKILKMGIPYVDDSAILVWHADGDFWEHPHFVLFPSMAWKFALNVTNSITYMLDAFSFDLCTRMISLINRLYNAVEKGNIHYHTGQDLPQPISVIYQDSYARNLDVKAHLFMLSVFEWYLYLIYNMSLPKLFYNRLKEVSLNIKLPPDFAVYMLVFLELRFIIELDYFVMNFIRLESLSGRFNVTQFSNRLLNLKGCPSNMGVVCEGGTDEVYRIPLFSVNRGYDIEPDNVTEVVWIPNTPWSEYPHFPKLYEIMSEELQMIIDDLGENDLMTLWSNMGLIRIKYVARQHIPKVQPAKVDLEVETRVTAFTPAKVDQPPVKRVLSPVPVKKLEPSAIFKSWGDRVIEEEEEEKRKKMERQAARRKSMFSSAYVPAFDEDFVDLASDDEEEEVVAPTVKSTTFAAKIVPTQTMKQAEKAPVHTGLRFEGKKGVIPEKQGRSRGKVWTRK